jgi:hypothetical protein
MAEQDTIEKIIEIVLPPNTTPKPTAFPSAPLGEVWQIIDVASLDEASPSFELAFHQNGVKQVGFDVNSVYERNNYRPMANSLADCDIYNGHLAYFVATPYLPLTQEVRVRVRLKIRRRADEMLYPRGGS